MFPHQMKNFVIFLVIVLIAVVVAFALLKKKGEAPVEMQAPTEQPTTEAIPEAPSPDTGGNSTTIAPAQPGDTGTAPSTEEMPPPAEEDEDLEELEEVPSP